METKWKRFSVERPAGPFMVGRFVGSSFECSNLYHYAGDLGALDRCWTHWCPVEPLPPRPAFEPSQAEKDEKACVEFDTEAFESWMLNDPCGREVRRRELHQAWILASGLARKHERAEIVKLLPTMKIPYTAHEEAHTMGRTIDAIRARCNGGSSK